MKLNVPEQLKVLLVDDWEAVTKNNQVRGIPVGRGRLLIIPTRNTTSQLVGLPRKPNVVELLEEFKAYVLAQGTSTQCVPLPRHAMLCTLLGRTLADTGRTWTG